MNQLTTSPWVLIHPLTDKKAQVEINIGNFTEIRNIPTYQSLALARNLIVSIIKRYVNHRDQVLHFHGGHLTPEKEASIRALKRALRRSAKWRLSQMPQIIDNWKHHLYNIRPGAKSKYYHTDIRILTDLLAYSHYCLSKQSPTIYHNAINTKP